MDIRTLYFLPTETLRAMLETLTAKYESCPDAELKTVLADSIEAIETVLADVE